MRNLFNPENPVMNFIGKLLDCFLLNILWFIFCIPIITIGASTTALYYCSLKLAKDEHVSLFQDFFHSFKENFIPGVKLTALLLLVGAILGFDGYLLSHISMPPVLQVISTGLLALFSICYFIILIYVFPLLSRFDNSIKNMILNSFIVGVRFVFCTILIAAIHFAIFFIAIRYFTPLIFFGMGLISFLSSYFLKNVLVYIEESQNNRRPDERV